MEIMGWGLKIVILFVTVMKLDMSTPRSMRDEVSHGNFTGNIFPVGKFSLPPFFFFFIKEKSINLNYYYRKVFS